uniref:Uncharacterized protein n=1 Tax=Glossina palpalis gambiensis TaxID=67801 RepID=A0A1B0BX95_9MUSC
MTAEERYSSGRNKAWNMEILRTQNLNLNRKYLGAIQLNITECDKEQLLACWQISAIVISKSNDRVTRHKRQFHIDRQNAIFERSYQRNSSLYAYSILLSNVSSNH